LLQNFQNFSEHGSLLLGGNLEKGVIRQLLKYFASFRKHRLIKRFFNNLVIQIAHQLLYGEIWAKSSVKFCQFSLKSNQILS